MYVRPSPDHVKGSPDWIEASPDCGSLSPNWIEASPDYGKVCPNGWGLIPLSLGLLTGELRL